MNYYNEIKDKLLKSEIYDKVKDYSKDRNKVNTYFEIGKLLSEAGKEYGKNIIKQYSEKLMIEVGKKYNERTLYRMRKFYEVFSNEKLTPMVSKLSWSHYIQLLSLKNNDEIMYYINTTSNNNLNRRELQERIKNNEYDRLSVETKNKLINLEQLQVNDLVPNPIIIMKYIELFEEYQYSNLIEFDKGDNQETKTLKYVADDVCCEYCYMGIVMNLFENDNIKSVKSNFDISEPAFNIEFLIEYSGKYSEQELIQYIEEII